jgi:hypothetical protein
MLDPMNAGQVLDLAERAVEDGTTLPASMAPFSAGVAMVMQDVTIGDARDCQCVPCGRLRDLMASLNR